MPRPPQPHDTDHLPGPVEAIEEAIVEWAEQWAARPRLRGWQHALAIVPAAGAAGALVHRARSRRERVAAAAWGAGIVGMLTASASYHRLPRSERVAKLLRRVDHAAIWGAVAGTWTPVALAAFPGRAGVALAGGAWATALVAAVAKTAAFDRVDRRVNVLYVVMGWAGVAIVPQAVARLGRTATSFLVAGGAAYTTGAILYAVRWPDLVPGVYGYHELWHTATLAGAGLQAVAVLGALEAIRRATGTAS